VVVYDRHLLDAIVTLDFVYGHSGVRAQSALVRALLPKADLTFYLDVPADVAVARKPGDSYGAFAVREQLARYEEWLVEVPDIVILDGSRPPEDLATEVLAWIPALIGPR
jgi:thymidylate kinase